MEPKFWSHYKLGWTFHAKQLTFETGGEMLTTIGSSNFGRRSFNRDNELTLFVYSDSKSFKKQMNESHKGLLAECKPFDGTGGNWLLTQ